jgi:hypothetical protein
MDHGDLGLLERLQENVEFYQNKCHSGNAPDMRRPCAKATDVWAQWVAGRPNSMASRPHFAASCVFPWR